MALAKGQSLASLRKDKELAEPPSSAPGAAEPQSPVSGVGTFGCSFIFLWLFLFDFILVFVKNMKTEPPPLGGMLNAR